MILVFELPFQGENTKTQSFSQGVGFYTKALPWALINCPFGTQNKKLDQVNCLLFL